MLFLIRSCRRLPVQCVEIADGITKVLRYIFIEMKSPIEERKGFVTGVRSFRQN